MSVDATILTSGVKENRNPAYFSQTRGKARAVRVGNSLNGGLEFSGRVFCCPKSNINENAFACMFCPFLSYFNTDYYYYTERK